ncbi:MAG: exo-alpha-sialidase [Bacteroidetes bacterium]|nr:exo-alpha-sialidase [Bacteroidota bacterium]
MKILIPIEIRTFRRRVFLIVCVGLLLATGNVTAQWQEPSCLFTAADSAHTAIPNYENLIVQGNFVHTMWADRENGKWRPTYRRSTDGGDTWEDAVHLGEPNANWPTQYGSSLAVLENTVYAVWADERSGESRIYLRVSTDNGKSWGEDRCITPDSLECSFPAIACDSTNVHVVYFVPHENKNTYIRSTDAGEHWTEGVKISGLDWSYFISIAADGSLVHAVYIGWTWGRNDIYYRRSTDGGKSWGKEVRFTDAPGWKHGQTVVAAGDDVHVVWYDYRTGFSDIHYCYSSDGGAHWGEEEPIMVTPYDCFFQTLAVSGQTLHLAWVDTRNDPGDIYYCRSDDAGGSWGPEEQVVSSPLRSRYPFLAVAGDALHLLWTDEYREIRYMRNPTGNAGVNATERPVTPSGYSLDQNYPNPFNSRSSLRFSIPAATRVTVTVHDLLGRTVQTVLDGERSAGSYMTTIDGTPLPPGSYLCRMRADDVVLSRMMTVLKK